MTLAPHVIEVPPGGADATVPMTTRDALATDMPTATQAGTDATDNTALDVAVAPLVRNDAAAFARGAAMGCSSSTRSSPRLSLNRRDSPICWPPPTDSTVWVKDSKSSRAAMNALSAALSD